MLRGPRRLPGRLPGDARGAAMVEFALVLPALLALFLGTFVMSDTMMCYRKVTVAARALADNVSRGVSPASTPSASTLATYINTAQLALTPLPTSNLTLEIDELRVCDSSHAYVVWSQAQTGSATATATQVVGSVVAIPANLVTAPMIPTSPDGSNVCSNTVAAPNRTLVGTAGGYLLLGRASYRYQPVYSFASLAAYAVSDQTYMIPRLN